MNVTADTVPWMFAPNVTVMLRCNVEGETKTVYYLTDIVSTYHGIAGLIVATGTLGNSNIDRVTRPIPTFFPWHNIISIHETQ